MTRTGAKLLVTGGAGFIGSNLADALAAQGHCVRVFDALARPGVERNLDWLRHRHGDAIEAVIADVRDEGAVDRAAVGVDAVFHLAAQVAVTTSLVSPVEDFEVNVGGTIHVLEAVRRQGRRIPVVFASTNKVYGALADIPLEETPDGYHPLDGALRAHGVGEGRPLSFHTPYGCSKGAADQYVLDYARSFDIPTVVFRMSCIYGPRQMGTEDQGWVAHFLIRALQRQPITLYGDGWQVRDILNVRDAVSAYLAAWEHIDSVAGRAFNLGGGPANAVSLRRLIGHIEQLTSDKVDVRLEGWRPGDQRYFVADASAARTALGLGEPLPWRDGVAQLAQWLQSRSASLAPHAREAAA